MAADNQGHRAGPFKQKNKSHKTGRHRSKSQIDTQHKGRVNAKSLSKRARKELNKINRRHQAHQRRQKRRDEILSKRRCVGGRDTAPHLVVVLGLYEECTPSHIVKHLLECDDNLVVYPTNNELIFDVSVPRFNKRFTFLCPPNNLSAILDAAKVADSLLCVVSPTEGIDGWGETCLTCLFAQGLPATTLVIQGLSEIPIKKRSEQKKQIQKILERRFPEQKLYPLDNAQEGVMLLRHLGEQKLNVVRWRDTRPHLMARNVTFQPSEQDNTVGTLKVSGFVRGCALSVNSLVHLPGLGDYQLQQIDMPPDPCPLNSKGSRKKGKGDSMAVDTEEANSMEEGAKVLGVADPSKQESLDSEAIPDPMEGEQTWPTEEELAEAEAALQEQTQKITKRVPKGTSEYQAAWIVDSGDEEDEDDDSDEDEDEEADGMEGGSDEEESDEEKASIAETDDMEYETISITEGKTVHWDDNYDEEQETAMLEKYRAERMNEMFPDEIDTPTDISARKRFARYRGLKSFRTSPWDPKENLPLDYARIFQFENFNRTKKRVLAEERQSTAEPGWYVTLHIANVPKSFIGDHDARIPLVIFGMLPHEQKMSVLHFAIKRYHVNPEPIKSKERLLFQVGYRRFTACPVFSQHSLGDKHKYDRFLPKETMTVASVYAPILFPPATVLMFKEQQDGSHSLIATGTLHGVHPDRIVAKKVVLSGHPLKIINKQAIVRYMFFNREDIMWFKPVELHTKWGRRGHIKEPLGTHGHMKCIFDGKLKSQDTILMNLYKRVYPKWTYDVVNTRHVNLTPAILDDQYHSRKIAEALEIDME
ncbi:pre-rRNA-processing protein TSR1 homolog [Amphiura filiformis]|uniref:pre-rRNA-processing protein TSR1 homolog n=1 Tax=Amphiura filiformis TaxID=82378 RepID=UPI003B215097